MKIKKIEHENNFIEYQLPKYLKVLKMRSRVEREMINRQKESGEEATDSELYEVIYDLSKELITNTSPTLEEIEEEPDLWPLMMEFISQVTIRLGADKKKLKPSETLPDLPSQV